MRYYINTPEYRIIVPGKPESFRTRRSGEYKRKVQHAARQLFSHPLKGPVRVIIDYFHVRKRRMDMDNVSKCILDALNGLAYADDRQVGLHKGTDHDLRQWVSLSDSVDLIKPLAEHDEYVIVRIRKKRQA